MRRRAADVFEVEAVDLEPIAIEPAAVPRRSRPPRRPAVWVVVVVVVAAVWGGIAFATRQRAVHKATPASPPASVAPAAPPARLPTSFVENFANIGTGRFAVVVNGSLYTIDGRLGSSALVDLGAGVTPVAIEDQSGREVLVKTPDDNFIVDTTGHGVTAIGADQSALSSHDGLWWFVGGNQTLSKYGSGTAIRISPGIAVLAALGNGFVVADNHGFAFWNRAAGTTRPIAVGATKLLSATESAALFATTCAGGERCEEIVHADGSARTFATPDLREPLSLSPDEHRLVVGNTVYDTTTGRVVASFTFPLAPTPMPYAWTSDGTLLFAIDSAVGVVRPNDHDANQVIGLTGLSQIAALP